MPAPPSSVQRIPFVDLGLQHAPLADELQRAFDRVLRASSFILGEEVAGFEEEFAAFCGVGHCVGAASGTAALTLALVAAGVGPGDEVILPAHTYIASALAVVHALATPVLCDVEEATGLIDADSASAMIGPRTAAILPVHLYGQLCDMDAIHGLGERHGLFILEDAAHAHGASYRGGSPGSLGYAAAFSFYPSKNLGALGDGGAICTNDRALADQARALRNLGQRAKGEHVVTGYNERLDGLQAALLRVKLPHLEDWNARRRELAAEYARLLEGGPLRTLQVAPERCCVYHLFPVRARDRDRLGEALDRAGVDTGIHYSPVLSEQPALVDVVRSPERLPQATAWAREELSLPMSPGLSRADVARVAAISLETASRR